MDLGPGRDNRGFGVAELGLGRLLTGASGVDLRIGSLQLTFCVDQLSGRRAHLCLRGLIGDQRIIEVLLGNGLHLG